jgi:hypothetical protein
MRLITLYIIGITDLIWPIEPDSNEALRRHLNAGGTVETFNS